MILKSMEYGNVREEQGYHCRSFQKDNTGVNEIDEEMLSEEETLRSLLKAIIFEILLRILNLSKLTENISQIIPIRQDGME